MDRDDRLADIEASPRAAWLIAGVSLIALLGLGALAAGLLTLLGVHASLQPKHPACETAAVGSLRTIVAAQARFHEQRQPGRFGTLEELSEAGLLDKLPKADAMPCYRVTVTLDPQRGQQSWSATAIPSDHGKTCTRAFYTDQSGVIVFTVDGTVPSPTNGQRIGG